MAKKGEVPHLGCGGWIAAVVIMAISASWSATAFWACVGAMVFLVILGRLNAVLGKRG